MRHTGSTIQLIRRARVLCAAALWILMIGVYPTIASGAVWHVKVDAMAANNGTCWTDAFTEVYSALDVATVGDEIWIAAGTYTPVDAASSLALVDGVGVYGGFVGTELSRNQSNVSANESILSGDIDADDNPSAPVTCPPETGPGAEWQTQACALVPALGPIDEREIGHHPVKPTWLFDAANSLGARYPKAL